MKKILIFLLSVFCVNHLSLGEDFNIESKPMLDLFQNQEVKRDGNLGVLSTNNFIVTNKKLEGSTIKFDLNIKIPDNWALDSNEKQDQGVPLQITLKDQKKEKINVNFPNSEEYKIKIGKQILVNHVYHKEVTIPISIENFNKKAILIVDCLTCGGEGECSKSQQEIEILSD